MFGANSSIIDRVAEKSIEMDDYFSRGIAKFQQLRSLFQRRPSLVHILLLHYHFPLLYIL